MISLTERMAPYDIDIVQPVGLIQIYVTSSCQDWTAMFLQEDAGPATEVFSRDLVSVLGRQPKLLSSMPSQVGTLRQWQGHHFPCYKSKNSKKKNDFETIYAVLL